MDYIRQTYGIPIFRGMRVRFHFLVSAHVPGATSQTGSIKSADQYLYVLLDGEKKPRRFHPTWLITYYNPDGTELTSYGDD